MPRIELERFEREDDAAEISFESFDRLAFAERAVAMIRPSTTTVAIYGGRRLKVETGKQWGTVRRWATLEVSPHASRAAIMKAVLDLREGDAVPFALDLLVSACR